VKTLALGFIDSGSQYWAGRMAQVVEVLSSTKKEKEKKSALSS
jgi:hypothetical protein